MTLQHIYLILAVVGFIAPYYFFISFVATHGLDTRLFAQQLFGTPISRFFAVDLLLSSLVFLVYLFQEAPRHSVKRRWIYLIVLFTVGLSFALPLFLYARESHLHTLPNREP